MGVEFGLLGTVEVRFEGRLVDVGHARQRGVLVVLAVEANRVVSADQLVERVWGDRAPHRARETLYNYLSRLRHALSPLPDVSLGRQAGGYVLTVDPMAVDVHRFARLVAQARASDDAERALGLFEQALGLWRGEPFTGLDTPWANALRGSLERDRFAVELDCTDLQLRRGRHGWQLGDISARAETYPLDERVAGQLMLALYRCGRQADALEHFQRLRVRLADELGIDPAPGLHQLYQQILTTDPTLTAPSSSVSGGAAGPVPRQLPARTPHFVGRATELRQLTSLLDNTTADGGTVVISAIDGTAGIGKTALALHWAHQAADRFPDGQLYVNLRGFDPTGTPLHPADALRGFLDAFAVPPERIPARLDAQAGLYRSLLTDRRVLVVLDNARDADQVRPLLPASPGCLVVITSRNQLPGLLTQHGAHPLTLDVLTTQEAQALLARHLGPDRINADPDAVTDLINHCARLPLALAIVAARAGTHPGFTLRVLAKELADEHTRLDALDTGEEATTVRAVLSWSYHQLSPSAARLFRLLGLHPGPDIALPAATHLADLPPHQARAALSELARAHLLTQHTPSRYTFHDLLRAYATHLSAQDPTEDQHAALTRLFDHYVYATTAAMDTLYPVDGQRRSLAAPPAAATPPTVGPATAQNWLDTERANLTAIMAHTAARGWHTHTIQLANTVLLRYLEIGGPYRGGPSLDVLAIYGHVREAARRADDHATEALALTNLGLMHTQHGRFQQATNHYQQALTISHDIGYRVGEAWALGGIGLVYWRQGHFQQATDHYQQALTISHDIGYQVGEALALTHIGLSHTQQGHFQQGAEYHQRALTISHDIEHRGGEAFMLTNLGQLFWRQGHYQQAAEHYQKALTISRDLGNPGAEAWALTAISLVYWRQGHYQQAVQHCQQALTICRNLGNPGGEGFALTNLGVVCCRQGHDQQAIDHCQQALAIFRRIGYRIAEALALTNLGFVGGQQGRYEQAINHCQQALTICQNIGDRASEPQIRNGLGESHHGNGQPDESHTQHTTALTLATEMGDRYEQARAHHGLGHTHHTTGDHDQARHHWYHALTLFTDLGITDADDVRTHLTALDQTS